MFFKECGKLCEYSGFASVFQKKLVVTVSLSYNPILTIMDGQTERPTEEYVPIKRSFIINKNSELKYEQKADAGGKIGRGIVLLLCFFVVLAGTGFLLQKMGIFSKTNSAQSTPAVSPTPSPSPSPVVPTLNRSEWFIEVQNGTKTAGAAKKIADKIKTLGYNISKTGNADKDNYSKSQLFVRSEFKDQIDLVIADLRDIIKIASVAGELKEGTASARIIIGAE